MNKKITDDNNPAELADLIDRLMSEGSGHINISASEDGDSFRINTVKSNDCSVNKGACCQPTELMADDDEY